MNLTSFVLLFWAWLPFLAVLARENPPELWTKDAIRLASEPVVVVLDGPAASRLSAASSHVFLRIKDLRAQKQPGVLFHIYLDLPAGAHPRKDDPRYVGTFNFFNAAMGTEPPPGSSQALAFDLRPVVQELRAKGMLSKQTTITILPVGVCEAESRPSIGRLELIEE
jgi:hypothetical protein